MNFNARGDSGQLSYLTRTSLATLQDLEHTLLYVIESLSTIPQQQLLVIADVAELFGLSQQPVIRFLK